MSNVAVRSQLTKALETLNAQLAEIKSASNRQMLTNGNFSYNPASRMSLIDIHRSINLESLLNIGAFLKSKKEAYDSFAQSKGLTSYPVFKWCDYTFDQWDNDLGTRIAVVAAHDQQKKIQSAKDKLERFLTEEDQLAMTLKELGLDK